MVVLQQTSKIFGELFPVYVLEEIRMLLQPSHLDKGWEGGREGEREGRGGGEREDG